MPRLWAIGRYCLNFRKCGIGFLWGSYTTVCCRILCADCDLRRVLYALKVKCMSVKAIVIEKILPYISLGSADQQLLEDSLLPMQFRKGSFLMREGEQNKAICFIVEGLMRSFYYDEEGREITAGFFQQNSFCTDLHSFRTGIRSQRSIEAIQDCQVLMIDKTAQNVLLQQIEHWAYFEQNYISNLLLEKVNFQRKLASSTAQEAYQLFLERYDQAALYAPRYQIASFLGISPFTLSRLKIAN